MDDRIARIIRNVGSLDDLAQFERNARDRNALTEEIQSAVDRRTEELGRVLVAKRTGLDVTDLSPAEEKIVQAVAKYVGIKRRAGRDATRTFMQLENRGLIESAEIAVAKSKPTQGYETLATENLTDLSYEQIIVDHPDEFSDRALWFARRTLGLPISTNKPPTLGVSPVQRRTEDLLAWLRKRADENGGIIRSYLNAEAAEAIGLGHMQEYGRVQGNIQSRLDFACYQVNLPPLGLTAAEPFRDAWRQDDRDWPFPLERMRNAARARIWTTADFLAILTCTKALPGQAHLLWKEELAHRGDSVRKWAYDIEAPSPVEDKQGILVQSAPNIRNPDWTREEHILGLDLYLRHRGETYGPTSPEIVALSEKLRHLAKIRGMSGGPTFRNPEGVSMKMMNFRRLDPEYTADGRVGLARGSSQEENVWHEFADDRAALARAVEEIDAILEHESKGFEFVSIDASDQYWMLICNPKKWAVDRFLEQDLQHDSWGVRKSDKDKFAPGQLAILRVGVDQRNVLERQGRPRLEAGIYALCEVESRAEPGIGANGSFWAEGASREAGWPTVKITYLRKYLHNPLTIARLREELPSLSPHILNGIEASTFPISGEDFRAITSLLKEDLHDLPSPPAGTAESLDALVALEERYKSASPEVKDRVSAFIERGPVGAAVKRAAGYRCQLCQALGTNPLGFKKRNGDHYVEAHHVMPVSTLQAGTLRASNIMSLCANHHRQMHYGSTQVIIGEDSFEVILDEEILRIQKVLS
jgi:predicted HNH restriction endonuclease